MAVNWLGKGFVSIQVQRMAKSGFWFKRSYSAISRLAKNDTLKNQELDILKHHDYFGVRNSFDTKGLFQHRVHMGHKSIVRNPYMRPFLFGNRLGVDIIDLNQTSALLGDALNFTAHIAYRKGVILLLTRVQQNVSVVENLALSCGEYSHCRKWRLGTFTDSSAQFGAMTRLPDLCIFFSTLDDAFEQHVAVTECAKLNIPSIGVVDSNCDPRLITYPIPGNDDSPTSVRFLANLFGEAIMKGKGAQT